MSRYKQTNMGSWIIPRRFDREYKPKIINRVEGTACVRCAACGKPIELTWTSSCEGQDIYCGDCWRKKGDE